VWGQDRRALFENAARGMVSLIGGGADPAREPVARSFTLEADDWETLLVDFLTEILYLIEDEGVIIERIEVARAAGYQLVATVGGRPGGRFNKEIKAVTYHNLAIRCTDRGFETTIVFDV
jgi:SHS2 domain-containing protein